jgi:hypothetical protein
MKKGWSCGRGPCLYICLNRSFDRAGDICRCNKRPAWQIYLPSILYRRQQSSAPFLDSFSAKAWINSCLAISRGVVGEGDFFLKRERHWIRKFLLDRIILFNENIVSVKLELSKPPQIIHEQEHTEKSKPNRPRGCSEWWWTHLVET